MLTQDDVIYFVLTDRFSNGETANDFDVDLTNPQGYHGGDFAGIVERIPYLKKLGITALWITPVYEQIHIEDENRYGYHGYWPLNFEKVDRHLYHPKPGIPDGDKSYLKDLVDQLHAAGIKVVLDMVVNHTGYNHPGITNGPDNPTPIRAHWFNPPKSEAEAGDIGGWLAGLPDFNAEIPEVADYFVRVIADWIRETGVDCIRMDTAKHVESIFWYYYKTEVKSKYPDVTLLGEVLEFNIDRVSEYQRHFAFDSLFDFPLQGAIRKIFIEGAPFTTIASPHTAPGQPGVGILDHDTMYTNHNRLVTLLDNHDLDARFITMAMNHGNHDLGWASIVTQLALTLVMTSRGIPQIYYGTELGMLGGSDPDNRRDMPWELLPDGLNPTPGTHEHAIFDLTQRLIHLRKSSEALKYGNQITLHVDDRRYVYLRNYRDEWVIVAISLTDEDATETLDVNIADNPLVPPHLRAQIQRQQYVDLLNVLPSGHIEDGHLKLLLPKRSAAIIIPFGSTFSFVLK
jgi:glycosidase